MDKNKKKSIKNEQDSVEKLELPWMLIYISSMFMFIAFLMSMFFDFHTSLFFAIWMWIVSVLLIIGGVSKLKTNKLSGALIICMGVVALAVGVIVICI